MGSNWIKWVKGLTRRAEVVRMASGQTSALVADRRRIAVACMEFWEWADDETLDGAIAGCTPDFIDDLVSLPGFYRAMVGVEWITETPQGIVIKNFARHNGESAKRRAMESDRKRQGRTSAMDADKRPQEMRTNCGPEKRREEKRIAAAAETAVLPAAAAISHSVGSEALTTLASFGIGRPALTELAAGGLSVETITKICERCEAAGKGPGLMVWELKAAIDAQNATRPVAEANRAILDRFRPVWAGLGTNRLQAKEMYLTENPHMRQYTGGPLEDLPRFQEWVIAKASNELKGKA